MEVMGGHSRALSCPPAHAGSAGEDSPREAALHVQRGLICLEGTLHWPSASQNGVLRTQACDIKPQIGQNKSLKIVFSSDYTGC